MRKYPFFLLAIPRAHQSSLAFPDRMVDAPSSYPLIGWNLPGTAIVIPDSKGVSLMISLERFQADIWHSSQFAAELLNKYFRHSTISSFARQLVSYGE